jgi:hypothetical protein
MITLKKKYNNNKKRIQQDLCVILSFFLGENNWSFCLDSGVYLGLLFVDL